MFIEASSSSNDPAPPDTDATNGRHLYRNDHKAIEEVIAALSQAQENVEKVVAPKDHVPKHTGEVIDVPEDSMTEDSPMPEDTYWEVMERGKLWIKGADGRKLYAPDAVWSRPKLFTLWIQLEDLRARVARKELHILSTQELSPDKEDFTSTRAPKRSAPNATPKAMPRRRLELAEDERQNDSSDNAAA